MFGLLRTSETLPTGPHDWEVVLSGQELLHLLFVAVSEICIMFTAKVDAQALFGVTDRPADRRVNPMDGRRAETPT